MEGKQPQLGNERTAILPAGWDGNEVGGARELNVEPQGVGARERLHEAANAVGVG